MTTELTGPLHLCAEGFLFPECPRWHAGFLYFSDMHDNQVYRLVEGGAVEKVVRLECNAGGLGFAPNGDLLVNAMGEGRVMRFANGQLHEHADLSAKVRNGLNDMVVSSEGRCYVGRYYHPEPPYDETIFFVDEFGKALESDDDLMIANGMLLTADGKRLIVAESGACRLAIFDLAPDGAPINKRIFAQLPEGYYPDGICGDSAGGVWAACTMDRGVVRVEEGGQITHRIGLEAGRCSYACALGGADGNTLFICTAGEFDAATHSSDGVGRIESVKVPFFRAGIP